MCFDTQKRGFSCNLRVYLYNFLGPSPLPPHFHAQLELATRPQPPHSKTRSGVPVKESFCIRWEVDVEIEQILCVTCQQDDCGLHVDNFRYGAHAQNRCQSKKQDCV